MTTYYKTFESIDDLAAAIPSMKDYCRNDTHFYGDDLYTAGAKLFKDFTKHKTDIDALIESMNIEGIFTTGLPMPETHYSGARPNIGAYLSGRPKTMWRRVESESSAISTPINIFVDVGVSAAISETTIVQRGIAVCALAAALRTFRPVSVYACAVLEGSDTIVAKIQVAEQTLDMGRMDYCFTSKNFCRRISFNLLADVQKYYSGCSWPIPPGEIGYDDFMRKELGIQKDDIFICGGYLQDRQFVNGPIQWVKDMVEKHKEIIRE